MAEEGAVTVCVRVRPLIERTNADLDEKGQIFWKSEECKISQVDGSKFFTFDRVFHSGDSTAEVYRGVVAPIIKSAVQGYNGTVFAYGQTASGKTYTMLGTKGCPGILQMAINDVFNTICKIPDREFLLRISYMEIHNETIQDLLCSNIRKRKPLVVREDINRTIYVEDLIEEVVIAPEQVLSWLEKGEKNRHYGETKMNERSSRSHTIFRMIIESKEKTDASGSSCDGAVMVSHLNLVDLAGSERASQTGAEGIRLKEGCNINRSLFILGQVIKRLCEEQFGGFVNYRDSKLTRILQNSLGGNAKTVIICTVTPASLEETLSTLQFASTAKKMKNSPKVNEVLDDDALLKRYRKEIEDLKRRLEEVSSHSQLAQILEEKNSLQKEQEEKIRTLTEMLVTASSFSQGQEMKMRRKRRVTWAPGAISQDEGKCFVEEFPERHKRFKTSLSAVGEMEESELSVSENSVGAASVIPEEEWIPGSAISLIHKDFADSVMLCETMADERDQAFAQQKVLQTQLKKLQSENEQLTFELKELQEKVSTDEFVALEKETAKEQEMQLMHEISKLKNVISNAEVYNQDLQKEISLKDLQLKKQKNTIKALEDQADQLKSIMEELKKESERRETSSPLSSKTQVLQNKDLEHGVKEELDKAQKMKEIEQLKDELKAWESKMKAQETEKLAIAQRLQDSEEEIRALNQEIGDLKQKQEALEHERDQIKEDIQETVIMNIESQEQLRNANYSLNQCQIHIKELEAAIVEKESQISGVKDILGMTIEAQKQQILKMTEDLDCSGIEKNQLAREGLETIKEQISSLEQVKISLQQQLKDLSKQKKWCLENNQQLVGEIPDLQSNNKGEDELCMKEQIQKCLSEIEQLKEEVKASDSRLKAEIADKMKTVQQLHEQEETIRKIIKERDDLREQWETLQIRKDLTKIQVETEVTQKLHDHEEGMRMLIQERDDLMERNIALQAEMDRVKGKVEAVAAEKLCEQEDAMRAVIQERDELRVRNNALQTEIDHIRGETDAEVALKLCEHEEAMRAMIQERDELRVKNGVLQIEMEQIRKEVEIATAQKLCDYEEAMIALSQERDELRDRLITENEAEVAQKLHEQEETMRAVIQERDNLRQRNDALQREIDQIRKEPSVAVAQMLYEHEEAMRMLIQERDSLREVRDALQIEKDQMKAQIEADVDQKFREHEEAMTAVIQEKNNLRERNDALQIEMDHIRKITEAEVAQKLSDHEEAVKTVIQERDDLREKQNALQIEMDRIRAQTDTEVTLKLHEQEKVMKAMIQERDSLQEKNEALQTEMDRIRKITEAEVAQKLCDHKEAMRTVIQERDDLKEKQNALQIEMDRIRAQTDTEVALKLHEQETVMRAISQERDSLQEKNDALQTEMDRIRKVTEAEVVQKLFDHEEAMRAVIQERDSLRERENALQIEVEHMRKESEAVIALRLHDQEKARLMLIQERDELKDRVRVLQIEKDQARGEIESEVTQKLHDQEEAIRVLIQEKDDLRNKQDVLHTERDQMKAEIQAIKLTMSHMIQEKEEEFLTKEVQLCEAQQKLSVMKELEEELKAKESELEAEKIKLLELSQRLCNSEESRKSLSQEKDDLKEKWESLQTEKETLEKFVEETSSKVKQLEEKSLELKRLLDLREEQYQENVKRFNEVEQLKITAESNLRAMEKEKAELFHKLHGTTENLRSLAQEKEKLQMVVEALQHEKDNMIQTINRLGETVEKTVAANLKLQSELLDVSNHNRELRDTTDISERKNLSQSDSSQTTDPLQGTPAQPIDQLKEEVVLAKFLTLEKRSENLKTVALNLKNELDNQRAQVDKWFVNLPPQQANNVKRLQMEHAHISNSLHSLVNKSQFVFCRLCKKRSEYYINIGKYTVELLEEKKRQSELLIEIQCLKPHWEQRGAASEQLTPAELNQHLDVYEKQMLKDISEMEEELLSIEMKLKEMESDSEKAKQYLERCSVNFEMQDFEDGIRRDNERLLPVGRFLKPISQGLIQAKSQIETKNNIYCRESEAALKTCREQTEQLLLELNTLRKEKTLGISALEEENYRLQNKLKEKEQELKTLKLKIQELENEVNEAERKFQEKEKKIAILETELKIRASRSEVDKLQAILEEKENCLRTALTERQALKVQLDKGAELYKEEIEDLKTQLAKAEMARMKQSKYFDQEMVNAKALAEHREEQLRKLREELRRSQHDQEVTVMLPKESSQPPLPITCGGGSGIVQSTQMLVLKNKHAKLENEYNQLKKQYELLSNNELALKEEMKKWKDRALKRKEQHSKVLSKEQKLETPRRTAPASFPDLPPKPPLQPVLQPETPPDVQSNFTGFFDNSHLGLLTDAKAYGKDTESLGAETPEKDLSHWIACTKKENNSNCKTQ